MTPPRMARAPGPRKGKFRLYLTDSKPPGGGISLLLELELIVMVPIHTHTVYMGSTLETVLAC